MKNKYKNKTKLECSYYQTFLSYSNVSIMFVIIQNTFIIDNVEKFVFNSGVERDGREGGTEG